jgi:hypothetical protein
MRLVADVRNNAKRSLVFHREQRKGDGLVLISLSRREWRGDSGRRAKRDGGDRSHCGSKWDNRRLSHSVGS